MIRQQLNEDAIEVGKQGNAKLVWIHNKVDRQIDRIDNKKLMRKDWKKKEERETEKDIVIANRMDRKRKRKNYVK